MRQIKIYLLIIFASLNLFSCLNTNSLNIKESQFYTDSIYSKELSEYRKHNIYLPKGFDSKNEYSIIYATDGSEINENHTIKKLLDSLIDNKSIKPILYVESYYNNKIADSSATTGNGRKVYKNYRKFEYVENQYVDGYSNPVLVNRFKNHLSYFANEFIPQVEKKLKLKVNKKDRLFYGYSNGAGFGVNLLNKRPELINDFICFSTLGSNVENNEWKTNIKYPNLFIEYGSDESFIFKEEAEEIAEKYEIINSYYELTEFKGGHDNKKWNEEFKKVIIKILKEQ